MAINRYSVRQLVPTAEIPSIEVFESRPLCMSDIFPDEFKSDLDGPLGDYSGNVPPAPDSPLCELSEIVRKTRMQAVRDTDVDENLTTTAQELLAATLLQKKLVNSINQAHLNLIEDGYAPSTTSLVIGHHVEERDQKMHHFYEEQARYFEAQIDRVRRSDGLVVPAHVLERAYSEEKCEAEDAHMLSPELQREAHMKDLQGSMRLNQLRTERLRFEWISSLIVIDTLKEATASSLPLALAS